MVLETVISSKHRIATIVTLAILAVGLLGSTISSALWWSRIQPWFGYGRGYYRVIYNCVFACFILSLIGFVALVIFGAINIFAKELYAKITGSLLGTTLVISIVGVCALAGLIPGAYAASWGVDRYQVPKFKPVELSTDPAQFEANLLKLKEFSDSLNKFEKDAQSHFCAGYASQLYEIPEKNGWNDESKKYNDFENWKAKLEKKSFQDVKVKDGRTLNQHNSDLKKLLRQYAILYPIINTYVDIDEIPEDIPQLPNTYLCEEVGVPTLIFTMITGLSMIIFFYLIVFNAYSQSDAEASEAEA
ncbi:hypothetical protein M9Y10_040661 [Tritrichomonas musculus]|uniref:Tetraspanin family protein n=1 Tax=Tritrichomonas musculus TaxID=1915356 RepID=A0ABR2K381_9EUKA